MVVMVALVPQATAGVLSENMATVHSQMSRCCVRTPVCAMVPVNSRSEFVIVLDGLVGVINSHWISGGNGTCHMYGGCCG